MKYIFLLFVLTTFLMSEQIKVTIIYGTHKLDKVVNTEYQNGTTALELLKKISDVQAVKTGKYNFVRSIDGVKSEVGVYGWFYLIDGESTHRMAEKFLLNNNKTMTWYIHKEQCN